VELTLAGGAAESASRPARRVARGVERVALTLDYARDSAVDAARSGPSVEELGKLIHSQAKRPYQLSFHVTLL
jgi:hypothetical protein